MSKCYRYRHGPTTETSTYNFNLIHVMDDQSRIATIRIGSDDSYGYPGIKYVVSDRLGSSYLQLAVNWGVMYREEFFPFGEMSFGIYMSKRYRYCGKEQDEESRYNNYGAKFPSTTTVKSVDDGGSPPKKWLLSASKMAGSTLVYILS